MEFFAFVDHVNSFYGIQNAGFIHPKDERLCRQKARVCDEVLRIKVLGDQEVYPNDIIARQRGFKWKSGKNVIVGLDQTIHAKVEGIVKFRLSNERKIPFYYIDVEPKTLHNRKYGAPTPYNYHPELFPERAAFNHP